MLNFGGVSLLTVLGQGVHAKTPLTKHIGMSQSQERLIKKSHRFLLLKRRLFCRDGEGGDLFLRQTHKDIFEMATF